MEAGGKDHTQSPFLILSNEGEILLSGIFSSLSHDVQQIVMHVYKG